MAETSTIFGFMKYVSATDILSDFKKTVDSYFVNSLRNEIIVPFSLEKKLPTRTLAKFVGSFYYIIISFQIHHQFLDPH